MRHWQETHLYSEGALEVGAQTEGTTVRTWDHEGTTLTTRDHHRNVALNHSPLTLNWVLNPGQAGLTLRNVEDHGGALDKLRKVEDHGGALNKLSLTS